MFVFPDTQGWVALCWLFGFRLLREADAALIHVGSEWEALS